MMRKILRLRETDVIINSSDEAFTSSSLVYIMRKDSQAALIVAGKFNMPYEIMIWFLEKLDWYIYNRKIDTEIYLKAMGTDFYPDGISDAVRDEINRRLGNGAR